MTDVFIRHPHHPNTVISIEERDENPANLTFEERNQLLERTRFHLGNERLWTSTYQTGDSVFDYEQLLRGSALDPEVARLRGPAALASVNYPRYFHGNVRTLRTPRLPFRWESEGISLVATPGSAQVISEDSYIRRWMVNGTITLPDEVETATLELPTSETLLLHSQIRDGNTLRFQVEVNAPAICNVADQRRVFVELPLHLTWSGTSRTIQVPVDHACLLGEGAANNLTLNAHAEFQSPAVRALVEEIRRRLEVSETEMDLEHAWQELLRSIRERRGAYEPDPVAAGGPYASVGYVLRPEETLRYGGDCEDWSILTTAVMRRLGFEARVLDLGTHAVTEARSREPGSSYRILDLVLTEGALLR